MQEAKKSIPTFEGLLGRNPFTVSLDKVRKYVTYPSPEEEAQEYQGGAIADRYYLAVKLAQVYCQFPRLGDAKVGLVDLPGLGEIGNSASDVHLQGLEDKVDQIFLVMRPTAAKAFTDTEVAHNLDQLQVIQPAVRRGDLILTGINKDHEAGQAAADNLRAHFTEEINAGRDDCYEIIDAYCDLDHFYGEHVDNFKTRILDIVLCACGMDTFFSFTYDAPIDERISKVESELGASIRDEDLDKALTLLKQVKFDFRSNMFLQIESHLAELANPSETYRESGNTIKQPINKRGILGGGGTALDKQGWLYKGQKVKVEVIGKNKGRPSLKVVA